MRLVPNLVSVVVAGHHSPEVSLPVERLGKNHLFFLLLQQAVIAVLLDGASIEAAVVVEQDRIHAVGCTQGNASTVGLAE